MCQDCLDFLDEVKAANHDTATICKLINNEPWYHRTRNVEDVARIKKDGLKLLRHLSKKAVTSFFCDGISLCKTNCWPSRISGNLLFQVRVNVKTPLYDVKEQAGFKQEYNTSTTFYQDKMIIAGYLGGVSNNDDENKRRTDRLIANGFDSVLFEENEHAVLVDLKDILPTELTYIGNC